MCLEELAVSPKHASVSPSSNPPHSFPSSSFLPVSHHTSGEFHSSERLSEDSGDHASNAEDTTSYYSDFDTTYETSKQQSLLKAEPKIFGNIANTYNFNFPVEESKVSRETLPIPREQTPAYCSLNDGCNIAVVQPKPVQLRDKASKVCKRVDKTLLPYVPKGALAALNKLDKMNEIYRIGHTYEKSQENEDYAPSFYHAEIMQLVLTAAENGLGPHDSGLGEDCLVGEEPCTTAERKARDEILGALEAGAIDRNRAGMRSINYPVAEQGEILSEQAESDFHKCFQRLIVKWFGPDSMGDKESATTHAIKNAIKDLLLDAATLRGIKRTVLKDLKELRCNK